MTIYLAVGIMMISLYAAACWHRESRCRAALEESVSAGLSEPASLHPVINPNRCIGCATCVHACPEGQVLGLIGGKAALVNPASCIGHGACRTACPQDAITLVFGTEKRGVDIPNVQPDFQTNVPGIYIAGELGGMGLIRNAITQGRQAMEAIAATLGDGAGDEDRADVLIIGSGPAGMSASLGAKAAGLRYVTLEQDSLGGTVSHFPRGKIVMTAPVDLPMVGKVRMTETTKEALMSFWEDIVGKTGVEINFGERVDTIEGEDGDFVVTTSKGTHRCRKVLLTIGRRGTPRKLGVPGEEQSKVVYRLIDPAQYAGRHVLVVGGGDSALEAAWSIAAEADTTVSLSYRSAAFSRAKPKNRKKVDEAVEAGRLTLYMKSEVREIGADTVVLEHGDKAIEMPNDAVIICAGGILPTAFLKATGIEVETKFGAP